MSLEIIRPGETAEEKRSAAKIAIEPQLFKFKNIFAARGFTVTDSVDGETPNIIISSSQEDFDAALGERIPFVLITNHYNERTIIEALDRGAQDVFVRPESDMQIEELTSRIKAILRRTKNELKETEGIVKSGNVEINFDRRTIRKNGKPLEISEKQRDLVFYLARTPGRIVSYEILLKGLGETGNELAASNLKLRISRARAVLEDDPKNPKIILTHLRIGVSLSTGKEDRELRTDSRTNSR